MRGSLQLCLRSLLGPRLQCKSGSCSSTNDMVLDPFFSLPFLVFISGKHMEQKQVFKLDFFFGDSSVAVVEIFFPPRQIETSVPNYPPQFLAVFITHAPFIDTEVSLQSAEATLRALLSSGGAKLTDVLHDMDFRGLHGSQLFAEMQAQPPIDS